MGLLIPCRRRQTAYLKAQQILRKGGGGSSSSGVGCEFQTSPWLSPWDPPKLSQWSCRLSLKTHRAWGQSSAGPGSGLDPQATFCFTSKCPWLPKPVASQFEGEAVLLGDPGLCKGTR